MYMKDKEFLFSVDVETDNLYGETFAIGVTIWDLKTREMVSKVGCYAELNKVRSEWCKNNILPIIRGNNDFMKVGYRTQMRDIFWNLYEEWRRKSIILADFQYPCEAGFFRQCVLDDLKSREWDGPYPMIDLGTMFICANLDPDLDRFVYTNNLHLDKHNPIHDSIVAAESFFKIWDFLGRL
jgi:hypothetical protein